MITRAMDRARDRAGTKQVKQSVDSMLDQIHLWVNYWWEPDYTDLWSDENWDGESWELENMSWYYWHHNEDNDPTN
jgi:hypothetical protein